MSQWGFRRFPPFKRNVCQACVYFPWSAEQVTTQEGTKPEGQKLRGMDRSSTTTLRAGKWKSKRGAGEIAPRGWGGELLRPRNGRGTRVTGGGNTSGSLLLTKFDDPGVV